MGEVHRFQLFVLRTLLPLDFLYGDCAQNHTIKLQFLWGQFLTKILGDFLNYFMKIIVLGQSYHIVQNQQL